MSTVVSVSTKDTATLVRQDLKRVFPGQKFSVRTEYFSGGSAINIRWTDGPCYDAVDAVVSRYRGSTFDGMIDLKSYVDYEDPQTGVTYSYGSDYVSLYHDMTPAHVQPYADHLCQRFGYAPRTVQAGSDGNARLDTLWNDLEFHEGRYAERRLYGMLRTGTFDA